MEKSNTEEIILDLERVEEIILDDDYDIGDYPRWNSTHGWF